MPRRPRELADGGIYHIFARGNNRQIIFQQTEDYEAYKGLLRKTQGKYGFLIFHYCLMSNHMHLLLQVKWGSDLAKLMHDIQLAYSRYWKDCYGYIGHLFQSRFRSPRIPEESYYLQCGRYIERNPVKAGLAHEAVDYPFSSAAYYVLGRKDPLVTPNFYYEAMGDTEEARRENYQKFLALDEPYASVIDEALAVD